VSKGIVAKEALLKKAAAFKQTFLTESGEAVLGALRDEFNSSDLIGKDTHDTYYKLGARDLLVYIEQMIEYNPRLHKQSED
jgi:hypothetical protein